VLADFLRAFGLLAFLGVFLAGMVGSDNPDTNVAPRAIFVAMWVGLTVVSGLVGDVWQALNPFDTLCAVGQRLRRLAGRPDPPAQANNLPDLGYWPAAVFLFGFVWLWLVFPAGHLPRTIAAAMGVYTAAVLAGAGTWGRPWLREGEAFTAWFGLLGRMAALQRDDDGRLRLRPPLAGLADVRSRPGLPALVLVALGGTVFDGLTQTRFWKSFLEGQGGGDHLLVDTFGLAWAIIVVAVVYISVVRFAGRATKADPEALVYDFSHALVPIAWAYAAAHYLSLLVFDGQIVLAQASDPLGRGWDLFGTATWLVNFTLSTRLVSWIQAASLVVGHVAAVVVVHDRMVARYPASVATRAQYPLLAAMVLSTVGSLVLLPGF
jgi:hypothetical protein